MQILNKKIFLVIKFFAIFFILTTITISMISFTVSSTIIYSAIIYLFYRFLRYFVNLQQAYRTLEPVPGPTIGESLFILWAFYRKRLNGFFNQKLSVPIGTAVKELARELCDRYGRDRGVVKVGYGLFPPYVYICNGKLAKVPE